VIFFSENKVQKLFIREFSLSKYKFRQDVNLNKCKLKRMSDIIPILCLSVETKNISFRITLRILLF